MSIRFTDWNRPGVLTAPIVARLSDPIVPSPTGRLPFSRGYQAINYLATIIQSLRDKDAPRESAPSPFRPFAVSLLLGREGQA